MKRPDQHVIDSQADPLFRAVFADWAVSGTERDYGRDYVVEIFRNGERTGMLFNVQLKGSRNTAYSADGTFVSQKLEMDSAQYLAQQLQQPTFLVHVDVDAKKVFWSTIQLDEKVLATITAGNANSLTVRIPTANVLPDNIERFREDLARAQMEVIQRILLGTKPVDFVSAMASHPVERKTQIAQDLHQKGFWLELDTASRQGRAGDRAGAISAINRVVAGASGAGYVEIHFNAVLQRGELEWLQLVRSDAPQAHAPQQKLTTARELCRITKRKPKYLHLAAEMMRQGAELDIAVQQTISLLMSWQAHRKRGDDPVWIAVLSFQLQQSLLATNRKYRQALRLARATASSQYRWVTSRPIAEIGQTVGMLATLLTECGLQELGRQYRQSAFDLFKFAAAIATENGSRDELLIPVMNARMLDRNPDGEIFQWIRSVINLWPIDDPHRKVADELMARAVARTQGATFDGDIQTSPRQIHNNFLTSQGIDPTTEPWKSWIDLAIKDDDPTRVLIGCEHKGVLRHPGGNPMLDRLGLERANPKIIGCKLHQYFLGGGELDQIDQEFTKRFCNACPDRVPRPANWMFYDEPF
jgi:hypothetical protein